MLGDVRRPNARKTACIGLQFREPRRAREISPIGAFWRAKVQSLLCRSFFRKKEMFLPGGGCGSCGSFQGVDDDGLLAALRGSGVDGIQVDAFRSELLEALCQRTRLVG